MATDQRHTHDEGTDHAHMGHEDDHSARGLSVVSERDVTGRAPHGVEHPQAPGHDMEGMAHGEHGGHGRHAGHSEAMFQNRFWISLILTLPVLVYAELFQGLLGYQAPAFPGSRWLAPVLASIIYWYGGWPFLAGARRELGDRLPGMMTLVSMAITTAYLYSLAVDFGLVQGMAFYWELATLVVIMLLGHWMEMRAVGGARNALNELAKLLPDMAERITDGESEQVPASALVEGDLVLVRPGGRIPADGEVEEGESQVNESMITGESRPVDKENGSEVIAGTVNGSGALRVRINRIGEGTVLAGIMKLVAEAQGSRSRAQDLADRAAYWLTLIAIGTAVITLVAWSAARGLDNYTLERVVTVLVVACPHALGLAIPLVIAISTALSAKNGILVRDRLALEEARKLDVVVFDKTGTLTMGEQGLVGIATADGVGEDEALSLAAGVERDSEHIIARAIVHAAEERGLPVPDVEEFQALSGRGVQASVAGRELQLGGPRLLEHSNVTVPPELEERSREWGERGQTVVYLLERDRAIAAFATADAIRPESREAVADLEAMGIRVAMLTGDSEEVARWVAKELGISTYFAEVLPEYKSERIKTLRQGGATVGMVGDGVNDAPALAQANVGIAIGAGTDVARAAAGIVLVKNDPRDVVKIVELSRASYSKMVQNLAWAVGYNAIALPLAAGVLAGVGFVLPLWVGAVLMSASTIIVALNAQTLRRLEFKRS